MLVVGGDAANRRTPNRVLGLLASLVGLVYAVWTFAGELRARRQSAESLQWPAVSGEVTASNRRYRAAGRRNGDCTWAEICFRYAVEGVPHTSCRATFFKSCSASTAAGLMTQFPVGAEVTVLYDPGAPGEAVLVPGSWRGQAAIKFWLALIGTLGLTVALSVRRLLRPPEAAAAIGQPPAASPQV
jgi:hypothetical protein